MQQAEIDWSADGPIRRLGRSAVVETTKYDYIDALRGYAILLVIAVHVGSAFPELPWPVKRFTNLGWYGVQLFFVVSSLTLAMSWHSRQARESRRTVKFFVRRFLRIAPMYYLATIYYLAVRPPGGSFSIEQLLASSTFLHGWSPALLPTTDNGWTVVPGSWSVAAEFGFYFLFPVLIMLASTLRRAALLLAISLGVGFLANETGFKIFLDAYGPIATDQFLFFWLPNQMPVFLSGILLFHLLTRERENQHSKMIGFARNHTSAIVGAAALAFLSVPFLAVPRLPLTGFPYVPIHVLIAWVFCLVTAALAVSRRHFLVTRPVIWMGRVSFSAYLLHFSVIPTIAGIWPAIFQTGAEGYSAIFHYAVLLSAAVLATFLVSFVTYKVIELPMIAFGKWICSRVPRPLDGVHAAT